MESRKLPQLKLNSKNITTQEWHSLLLDYMEQHLIDHSSQRSVKYDYYNFKFNKEKTLKDSLIENLFLIAFKLEQLGYNLSHELQLEALVIIYRLSTKIINATAYTQSEDKDILPVITTILPELKKQAKNLVNEIAPKVDTPKSSTGWISWLLSCFCCRTEERNEKNDSVELDLEDIYKEEDELPVEQYDVENPSFKIK